MSTVPQATAPAAGAAPTSALLERVRRGIVGDDEVLDGPYGRRRISYADYTASGRSLDFLEDFIRSQVLPRYANTRTESSGTGLQTTRLREEARRVIRDAVGGSDDDLVIFTGSGATAAVNKLIGILEALLAEVHHMPLDEEGRHRLVTAYNSALAELDDLMPADVREELVELVPPMPSKAGGSM